MTPNDIKGLIEGMMLYSWPAHLQRLVTPFPVMTFEEAIEEYGSDKPDTRFGMKVSLTFFSFFLIIFLFVFNSFQIISSSTLLTDRVPSHSGDQGQI